MKPFFPMVLIFLIGLFVALAITQENQLPQNFQQIIPRGRIASIDNPQYVPADKAKISDNSWVLGVVINGQARAYSLTLLNSHEVVNDKIDGKAFSAVW